MKRSTNPIQLRPAARVRSCAWVVSLSLVAIMAAACAAPSSATSRSAAGEPVSPAVTVVPFASSAAIWFQPQPPGVNAPFGHTGSSDYLALFRSGSPWQRVLAHTQAVGFTADWLYSATNHVLQQVVAFLNQHRIGIEIEAASLQARPGCGSGIEGFVPFGLPGGLNLRTFTLSYLQRLRALGAHVLFVKVDEPFYYGSAVSAAMLQRIAQASGDQSGLVSCHFSMAQVAQDVGQFVRLVHTVYPDAAVGDVEPVGPGDYGTGTVAALDVWHDTYRAVTGAPFPFFFADVNFGDPAWPALVQQLAAGTRQLGMKFGIIYIGDVQDDSDAEWTAQVAERFEEFQRQAGGQPDYVLFQSWQPRPVFCLPETDPATFTGVINTYITATTPHRHLAR